MKKELAIGICFGLAGIYVPVCLDMNILRLMDF